MTKLEEFWEGFPYRREEFATDQHDAEVTKSEVYALCAEIEQLRAYIAQRQWEHAADSAHEHCPAPSAQERQGTGTADTVSAGNEGAIPSGAADTTTLAGMRRYIFQQLGFLTDDDNRPAEGLIRLAAKRLAPKQTAS